MLAFTFLSLLVLTSPLTFYTCRHSYEPALMKELSLSSTADMAVVAPGLLRIDEPLPSDPAYALQTLPASTLVTGVSAKELSNAALASLDTSLLVDAPKGGLRLHVLVPDLLKGRPAGRSQYHSRVTRVGQLLSDALRKQYPCARKADDENASPLLLQLLLIDAETMAVSLASPHLKAVGGSWPNVQYPAGLAPASALDKTIEIDANIAGSAYRKLLEALALIGPPAEGTTVCDLGASPGSWTQAMRRLGCTVTAVDRATLAPSVMEDAGVTFVQGDAFSFEPYDVDFLVSDIIAFPERVVEIIESWAGKADRMVLTMKFKGSDPIFEALQSAKRAATKCGYSMRAKHFFSNKNEVTLMLRRNCFVDDDARDYNQWSQ